MFWDFLWFGFLFVFFLCVCLHVCLLCFSFQFLWKVYLRAFNEHLRVCLLNFQKAYWCDLPYLYMCFWECQELFKAQFLFAKSSQAFNFELIVVLILQNCAILFCLAFCWESVSWSSSPDTDLLKVLVLQLKYKFGECIIWINYDLYCSSQGIPKMLYLIGKHFHLCSVYFCTEFLPAPANRAFVVNNWN